MTRTPPTAAKTRARESIATIAIDCRFPGGAHTRATPSAQRRHKRRASRNRFLALLLGSVAAGAMQLPEHALAETKLIETPAHARLQGLESLRRAVRQDGGVPLPENLDDFIKDREAAVQLGKALFWDMQVGSDGVQSCASCHFHAGADNRTKNPLNPARLTFVDDPRRRCRWATSTRTSRFQPPLRNPATQRDLDAGRLSFRQIDPGSQPRCGRYGRAGIEQQQRHCRVDGHVLHLVRWRPAGVSR